MNTILIPLLQVISIALDLYLWVVIAAVILSWLVAFNVINTHNHFVRQIVDVLDRITRPIYRPIRKILPDFGGLDFSPLVVLLIVWALQQLLIGAMRDLYASGY